MIDFMLSLQCVVYFTFFIVNGGRSDGLSFTDLPLPPTWNVR